MALIWIKGAFASTPLRRILGPRLAHTDEGRREKDFDAHAKEFQLAFCVRDATVLHAYSGKVFMDSSRESWPIALIRELLEGAESDKHPCKRIRVRVSRMLGHDSGADIEFSK